MTEKTPKDVEPGSDADITPVPPVSTAPPNRTDKHKPASQGTGGSQRQDDSADEKGNEAGGGHDKRPT